MKTKYKNEPTNGCLLDAALIILLIIFVAIVVIGLGLDARQTMPTFYCNPFLHVCP